MIAIRSGMVVILADAADTGLLRRARRVLFVAIERPSTDNAPTEQKRIDQTLRWILVRPARENARSKGFM
ncbi:hypothetical protein GCM10022204_26840 [Microlunatus aurantiacus]|uniref:Uncharacterized protein n=1 Tax=Microlunatus aurantiacus TaxID=446786 RepID=A0ABP7DM92_9ACTN